MRWAVVVLLGVALGGATAAADVAAGGLDQTPLGRGSSMLLNAGFLWAGSAVLAGWIVGRSRFVTGAGAGFVVLICAVASYYGYGVTIGDRSEVGFAALSGVIRLWLVASVVAGPVLGVAGVLTHRRDFLGLLARWVVPSGALVEMVLIRRLGPESFRVDPTLAWTQFLVVVLACLGAVWAVLSLSGWRSGSKAR